MRTQQIGTLACLLAVSLGLLAGCESTGGLPSNAQTLTLLRQQAGDDSGVNDAGVWLLNSTKDVEGTGSKTLAAVKVDFNTATKPAKGEVTAPSMTTPYVAVVVAKIPAGGKVRSEIDSVTGKPVPPLAAPAPVAPAPAPAAAPVKK